MTKIAIIGGGNMGEALIKGLHKHNRVFVCEANIARVQYLKKKYQLTAASILDAVKAASVIILAVKPQDMLTVLGQIPSPFVASGSTSRRLGEGRVSLRLYESVGSEREGGKLFISIAAGLTTKYFEQFFSGRTIAVVRCMPNMPALIGEGITGICAGKNATAANLKAVQKILQTIGQTVVVNERMMDAVTAVSGSGPAYVFLFVEQWMAAAQSLGFKESEAKALVYKTLLGSAHLLEKSAFDAAALRLKVASKGGTTQAAMDVFAKRKFDQIMKQALLAAKKRAKEMSK